MQISELNNFAVWIQWKFQIALLNQWLKYGTIEWVHLIYTFNWLRTQSAGNRSETLIDFTADWDPKNLKRY